MTHPVRNETAHRVKHLPETHHFPSNIRWAHLINIRRPRCQRDALSHTHQHSAPNEDANIASGSKALHKRCNYNQNGTSQHASPSPEVVGNGSTEEPACYDSADIVGCVKSAVDIRVLRVRFLGYLSVDKSVLKGIEVRTMWLK